MAASTFVQQVIGSETVTLLVGSEQEEWKIPKALLTKSSSFLAALIDESTGVINFQNEPVTSIDMFVRWCYQERLPPLDPKADGNARKALKRQLIELWIFASNFEIPKLQNEAMQMLLTTITVPHLISKADVSDVWESSALTNNGLKWFMIYALIAQMEEDTGEHKTKIGELDGFRREPGFMVMLYKALRLWSATPFPKTPKKGRTRWIVFAASEDVKRHVMVSEKKKPIQKTAVEKPFVAKNSGPEKAAGGDMITEKLVVVKREAAEDFDESDSPSKKGPGATQEDAIMLDDD